MKFLLFDDFKLGALNGNEVVDVSSVVADTVQSGSQDLMVRLIRDFDAYKPRLEKALREGKGISVSQVRVREPISKPQNFDCMAVNYMEGRSEPPPINAFHKSPSCIIGHGDTMVLPDVPATIFEGEAELAFVIGKRAYNVSAKDAMSHVFGYLNFIDGSARGLPPSGNTFFQAKSRQTFAPIGPYLVTADEIKDPGQLQVRLWVNGRLTQDYNTSGMAHQIARSIEWLSSIHTLEPGDIVATGTNHQGLSAFQDGDRIELETEGLGRLAINVQDKLKRTWARETRAERKQKKLEGVTTPQLTGKYSP